MLTLVGFFPPEIWNRAPHPLSGGQCQRVSLARAMMPVPALLICNEPVSALDVSVQAQILNLLHEMAARFSLTMLFIRHDLAVIRNIADRVAVMYLGKIVETGATLDVFERPRHPYSAALLRSVLPPGRKLPERDAIEGELLSAIAPPSRCRFRTRCPRAEAICAAQDPKHRCRCLGSSGGLPLSSAPVGSIALDQALRA